MNLQPTTGLRSLLAILLTGTLIGCAAPNHQGQPVQIADVANQTDQPANQDDAAAADQERAEDARKLAKLDRDLTLAEHKLARAKLARTHSDVKHGQAVAVAQRELDLQRQRLATFNDRSAPLRIEETHLDLTRAEDRAKESDEELKQLELMYAEEDFADQTKEIVLQRGRRNLARSLKALELKRQKLSILTERTLPTERTELEMSLAAKERALQQAQRDAQAATLDQQIAILSAESEVARLNDEIQAHRDKMADDSTDQDDTE